MKIYSVVLLIFSALFPATGFAEDCNTDCHKQCEISGIGFSFVEPTCHLKCEAAKKLACQVGSVPTLPITPLEQAKKASEIACAAPFEALTKPVIAACSNWDHRLDDQDLIEFSARSLVNQGFLNGGDFSGVSIRWCPHINANGITPDSNKVYLNPIMKAWQREKLVSVVAHEMLHVRQFRARGTDNFKCEYSRRYVDCGGCQNKSHGLEKEAYDFDESVGRMLRSGYICAQAGNTCMMSGAFPIGWGCNCYGNAFSGIVVN